MLEMHWSGIVLVLVGLLLLVIAILFPAIDHFE